MQMGDDPTTKNNIILFLGAGSEILISFFGPRGEASEPKKTLNKEQTCI